MNEYDAWSASHKLDEEAFGALFIRLTGQVVRTGPFPLPTGYSHWSDEAVADVAGRVYASKSKGLALRVLGQATSQNSLERIILATVERALIDEAKSTETGKLRRRLVTVLGRDARFVHLDTPEECWALVGRPQEMWQGDLDDLLEAARAVRGYTITTWNVGGPTAAPVKQALREISHGVLDYADGAVRDQELAIVVRERFVLIAPLQLTSSELLSEESEPVSDSETGPEAEVVLIATADAVWALLDADERAALAYVGQGQPVEEWAPIVDLRPAEAELVEERVLEELRLAVADDQDARALLAELRGRSIGEGLGPPELRRLLLVNPDNELEGEGDD